MSTEVQNTTSSQHDAKLFVVSSYLRGLGRIHDFEFADLAEKHGRTEEELIEDLVNEGWTIGKDESGHNVWWE